MISEAGTYVALSSELCCPWISWRAWDCREVRSCAHWGSVLVLVKTELIFVDFSVQLSSSK